MKISKIRISLIVISALVLAFIWVQSALPVKPSGTESKTVTEMVVRPLEKLLTGRMTLQDPVVRKWAHVAEYAVFGILLFVLLVKKDRFVRSLLRVFSYGTGIAVLDESIQVLSKRGPDVRDIWIDALGILAGILAGCVIWGICHILHRLSDRR